MQYEVDASSDGGGPQVCASDLGCNEIFSISSSQTPAAPSSVLNRSAYSTFSFSGSTHSLFGSAEYTVPHHVELLATHLFALANNARSDKKAFFVEKIAGLVRNGDIVVSSSFRPPETHAISLEPSPRLDAPNASLFQHGSLLFKFSHSTFSDSAVTLHSTDAAHLECVASKLFTLNSGRTRLSASGGSVALASSKPLSHSFTIPPTGAQLALVTLAVDSGKLPGPHHVHVALPLAGTRLDASSTSAVPVTPQFTGALVDPISFASFGPSAWRLHLRRGTDASDSLTGSPSSATPSSSAQVIHVTDAAAPTVVQLHPATQYVVAIAPAIEGVATVRYVDRSTVLLYVIPGAHHYPGNHLRLPLLEKPAAPAEETKRALNRKRTGKREAAAAAAAPVSREELVRRLHHATLTGDEATVTAILLNSAVSTTELLNSRSAFGETLLHLAVSAGSVQLVKSLLHKQADLAARDHDGLSSVQWAELQHNSRAREILHVLQDRAHADMLYRPEVATAPCSGVANAALVKAKGQLCAPPPADLATSKHARLPLRPLAATTETAPTTQAPPAMQSATVAEAAPSRKRQVDAAVAHLSTIGEPAKRVVPARRAAARPKRVARARTEETSTAGVGTVDWLDLPPHLLVYIISLVSYDDAPAVLRTCRTFRHLASPWRVKELRVRPPELGWHLPDIITPKMREILVDWLIEVQQEYKLHRKTLFLAVSYIDRVLGSSMPLTKRDLQLLGATCMWIAAKFEELMAPSLRDFEYICEASYRAPEVRVMHTSLSYPRSSRKWRARSCTASTSSCLALPSCTL